MRPLTFSDLSQIFFPFVLRKDNTSCPSILLLNARSLLPKFDELKLFVYNSLPDIICVTETWLHRDIDSSLIYLCGYVLFRCDRLSRRGGGCCVWVKTKLSPKLLSTTSNLYEGIWFTACNFCFTCLYIPPTLVKEQVDYIVSDIISFYDNDNYNFSSFCLMGDFNRFDITHFAQQLGVTNIVKEPTRENAILDLILCDKCLKKRYKVKILAPLANSDHNTVLAEAAGKTQNRQKPIQISVDDLRQSNVDNFVNAISKINWTPFYRLNLGVSEKCDIFNQLLLQAKLDNIPSEVVRIFPQSENWISPVCHLIYEKKNKAKKDGNKSLQKFYADKLCEEISLSKMRWATKKASTVRGTWDLAGHLLGRKHKSSLTHLIEEHNGEAKCANEINKIFFEVYGTRDEEKIQALTNSMDSEEWHFNISLETTKKMLHDIDPNKGPGSDGLHPKLLREARDVLAGPVTHLFNTSILQRRLPQAWKISHIVPIPKTAKPTIHELRPISLLPILSKILERCVLNDVGIHLVGQFGPNQFAYRKQSSTTCALIAIHEVTTSHLDKKDICAVKITSFDLSKAFDCVSHLKLISKLGQINNLPNGFTRWLSDYLLDRQQCVRVGKSVSEPLPVPSGVPQGSILGPHLFSVYFSDVQLDESSPAYLVKYADDMNTIHPISAQNTTRSIETVKSDTRTITEMVTGLNLRLNQAKSKCLTVTKKNISQEVPNHPSVNEVDTLNILGVTFNKRLSWHDHIAKTTRKCSKSVYALRVLHPYNRIIPMKSVYYALIRSSLEYASPLFIGMSEKLQTRLENIQRRTKKLIPNSDNMPGLKTRRSSHARKLFKQSENETHILHKFLPKRLRSGRYECAFHRTSLRQNSFFPLCVQKGLT